MLLTPRSPENQSADALLARLAVLFSSGHRRAVGVFGEGYEARLPILTGPVPEGGVPDGIR
ncbi:hypothetical protein [Streptomyces sp. NPDC051567]|uniref:hypothetical protein n=1 Tax=Streptomyces sp. NPDC051567 TaxID=3365660 RepID=UPI00379C4C18